MRLGFVRLTDLSAHLAKASSLDCRVIDMEPPNGFVTLCEAVGVAGRAMLARKSLARAVRKYAESRNFPMSLRRRGATFTLWSNGTNRRI